MMVKHCFIHQLYQLHLLIKADHFSFYVIGKAQCWTMVAINVITVLLNCETLLKKKTLLQFTKHGYNCHISLHCAGHYFIAKGHSKPICQKEKDIAITSTKMKFPFSIPFCQDSQKSKELCHKLMLMLNVPESQMRRSHQNISYKQQISTTSVFTVHCKN